MKIYIRSPNQHNQCARGIPRIFWAILILGLIVQTVQLTIVGCSHTSPYYHPDVPSSEKEDIFLEDTLLYRILLIGDGGEPKPDEPVLKTLQAWAAKSPDKTSLIFLGDNMYPEGMTERKQGEASTRLDPQLEVVTSAKVHGLFIPGNHDWANGRINGYRALLSQEKYINNALTRPPKFLPKGGTPGPVVIEFPEFAPIVRVIVLDTQWWLHQNDKPEKMPEKVIAELKASLDTELPVLVVGHHPLQSYGVHGGFYDWKAHLFPFRVAKKWLWIPMPIVGSLYPLTRWYWVKSDQDFNSARYKAMVAQLNAALTGQKKTPLLIYASGHEHSLQVLKGDEIDFYLVSGLGSSAKATAVSHGDRTLFAHEHAGFMSVDFLKSGNVLLRVVEPREAPKDLGPVDLKEKDVLFHHRLK